MREEASTVSEGFVVRQEPVGVKLPRGQTVTIYVSIGDRVLVPEITGMNEADARARIAAAGLFVSFIDVQGCDKLGQPVRPLRPRHDRQLGPAPRHACAARHWRDAGPARAVGWL